MKFIALALALGFLAILAAIYLNAEPQVPYTDGGTGSNGHSIFR